MATNRIWVATKIPTEELIRPQLMKEWSPLVGKRHGLGDEIGKLGVFGRGEKFNLLAGRREEVAQRKK